MRISQYIWLVQQHMLIYIYIFATTTEVYTNMAKLQIDNGRQSVVHGWVSTTAWANYSGLV